jgi:hypothetical protein
MPQGDEMIRAWLDLSAPGMFAALCVLYYGIALILTLTVFRSRVLSRRFSVRSRCCSRY